MVPMTFLIAITCLTGLIRIAFRFAKPATIRAVVQPTPPPALPAFLARAQDSPARIHHPTPRIPARTTRAQPVEIVDFDPAEDVIAVLCAMGDPAPQIQLNKDSHTGNATVIADGRPVAVIRAAGPEFSMSHVAVKRQAA